MVRADRDSGIPLEKGCHIQLFRLCTAQGCSVKESNRVEIYLGGDLTKKGCFILFHTCIQYGLVMALGKIQLMPHRGSKKQGC